MPSVELPPTYKAATKLSVIIPVRNEADNILNLLQDLEQQTYPKALFEVLVIDDASDDEIPQLVAEYAWTSSIAIKYLKLSNYVKQGGKKAAVQQGVELAKGELLIFTDGDCRVQPEWLALFAYAYTTKRSCFISGPVSFHRTHSWFEKMQLVEFASLIGTGGASIGLGKPNMCNGANLAYTKAVFQEVRGFAGNEAIASGDDEFLLHKVAKVYPDRISFLKSQKAIVHTEARKTVGSFISQRVRWASKWKSYQNVEVQLLAATVFLVNLMFFLAIPAVLLNYMQLAVFVMAYVVKFVVDCLFLKRILHFLGKPRYLLYMLPLQFVYIPYVVLVAIYSLLGRYTWKGRNVQNL
ncbi:glycosyltransferase family 2 protein [Pontibacter harenae]|uniref:glycosyltransferase family 2 protein n=1 Tax=Pontibacter harenae TaxID=2894083 RepID=UPI001E637824|nr:glycosyltransferase [Pontibacter harenae]MCC9165646.1 glycosyltransferase [Pontibacter harenae]